MKYHSATGLTTKKLTAFVTMLSISALLMACGGTKTEEVKQVVTQKNTPSKTAVSLKKIDVQVGNGATAKAGQKVSVHYTGWLYDPEAADNHGTKFDSSVDRGQPFQFPLGGGRVIKGWDQGVAGMKVGGKRTLIIPPAMAYGARGAGRVIPPNATLIFDVELLGVE